MLNPRINPVILLSPVQGGYVAYDPAHDRLHHLNPVAALLAELCDGTRSIEEIRDLVGPLMPEGKVCEIDRWIDDGIRVGLLLLDSGDSAGDRELPATDRSELRLRSALFSAKYLKETGKIQSAYLSWKRAVELNPDDWDAWYDLGRIAQCLGHRGEARVAYQKYFNAYPEDGEIEHLLIALRDGMPPPRASDRAIQHIYKSFAANYDARMREDLKYVGPERMQDAITAVIGDRADITVLDLGCGSGLAGVSVRERAAELVGIDLSPEMIELARARGIYDRLEIAEITEWLDQDQSLFDLIISCDCLIYFGDLSQIARSAARRLKQGGFLAMSMERGDHYPFHLTDTGRYTHHPDHIREAAAKSGLTVARLDESFLRMDYGEEVLGLYAVLGKEVA